MNVPRKEDGTIDRHEWRRIMFEVCQHTPEVVKLNPLDLTTSCLFCTSCGRILAT